MEFPKLFSKAILSPMAGVTDVAFRALAKKYGAGLTCTEFVSSKALVQGSRKTEEMLRTDPAEKPVAVQLFGADVEDVVEAARQVEDRFDVIDVNCGCPAWKVIKTGAGSELLKKPAGIGHLVSRLTGAVNKPITVKIRAGIDEYRINAVEVAQIIEDAGAAAIGVHGRTQKQGYRGEADWGLIKQVKGAVDIPVIGNGDVFTPETFKRRLEESGVDFILIARGAQGNPDIFRQINAFMRTGSYEHRDKKAQFKDYLSYALKYAIGLPAIKEHAMSFTKGMAGSAQARARMSQTKSLEEIGALVGSCGRTAPSETNLMAGDFRPSSP